MKRLLMLLLSLSLYAANDPPLLVTGVGLFHMGNSNQGMLQLEYRGSHNMFHLHTLAGVNLTTDESFLGYLGLSYDIGVTSSFKITPSFAVGGYARGNGVDLGSWVIFRPAIDVSRVWSNKIRLGANYSYLSNFGISSKDPGAHNFSLFVAIPLSIIL